MGCAAMPGRPMILDHFNSAHHSASNVSRSERPRTWICLAKTLGEEENREGDKHYPEQARKGSRGVLWRGRELEGGRGDHGSGRGSVGVVTKLQSSITRALQHGGRGNAHPRNISRGHRQVGHGMGKVPTNPPRESHETLTLQRHP